jgi:NTE family protein
MKIGLALGSGAARGCAHVGVIRALAELGIRVDIVCGCSIGALVGAAHAAGRLDRLEAWLRKLTRLEMLRYFELGLRAGGLIDRNQFDDFLAEHVCPPDLDIGDLDTTFAAVATDVRSGREAWLQTGLLIDAVRASIALPGLFRPVSSGDHWLVDGGIVNPVPVSLCRALGADTVIAVNLNADIVGKHFAERRSGDDDLLGQWRRRVADYSNSWLGGLLEKTDAPGLFDTLASSFNIMQDRITRSRMAGDPPEVTLSPRLAETGLLEFYRAQAAIDEGRACVERMERELCFVLGR